MGLLNIIRRMALREKQSISRLTATAYGLGIVMSAAILVLLGNIKPDTPFSEMLRKIAIQSVPASIGALLGRALLGGQPNGDAGKRDDRGGEEEDEGEDRGGESDAVPNEISTSYGRELFLMAVGALFLNLNVAPIHAAGLHGGDADQPLRALDLRTT